MYRWVSKYKNYVDVNVLHCSALHCTTLHYTALYCTEMHCTVLFYSALYCVLYDFLSPINDLPPYYFINAKTFFMFETERIVLKI